MLGLFMRFRVVFRFLLGREQENGEISRLLQQEEQAAAAAAQTSAYNRASNVNQSHHGTSNDEASMLQVSTPRYQLLR